MLWGLGAGATRCGRGRLEVEGGETKKQNPGEVDLPERTVHRVQFSARLSDLRLGLGLISSAGEGLG